MGKFLRIGIGVLLAMLVRPVHGWAGEDDPAYLALGAGYFDFLEQAEPSADFRVEYRSNLAVWRIKPWIGLEVNSDGAVFGGGGLLLDLHVGDFVLTPSAGVGGYANGDSRDLGSVFEFRIQADLAYQFENRSRLAVYFSHISNAGIGDSNPGTEIIGLYYMVPADWLF